MVTSDPDFALFSASITNADDYIKNAQLIFDNDSIAHARVFSLLAFEEIGKALYGFYCYVGIKKRNKKDYQILFKGSKAHINKQMLAWELIYYHVLQEWHLETKSLKKINSLSIDHAKGKINSTKYVEGLLLCARKDGDFWYDTVKYLLDTEEKFNSNPRWLTDEKEKAMYVNFISKDKGFIITSPQDGYQFNNETTQNAINTFSFFINLLKKSEIEIKSSKRNIRLINRNRPIIQKTMEELRDALGLDEE